MSPEPPGGPAAPRPLLLLLGPPALLLLLRAAAVRGDCGLPPVIPHAQPVLGGSTTFPENATVLYTCDQDFVKIPGMADAVVCLSNDKWTDIEEFCNRSCDVPPRLSYAALKRTYISKNYFPVGTIVEYECRPGHKRVYPLVGKITCLDNLTWSTPATFCEKKPCPNPGEILNGYVNVTTDLLFGSQIFFSCDVGYRLHGVDSAFCMITGNAVDWSNRFPVCIKPPQIKNGRIINEEDTYEYGQVVTYECDRKFTLTGKKHISCTVKGDTGEWSDPAPECKGTSPPPFIPPQKPSTTNVPATEAPLPPQKPTIVNIPGMEVSSTSQKSTTVNVPTTRVQPTPQKHTTVNVLATRVQPTPQKPITVNVPATRVQPTPQKHTTVNAPTTGIQLTPQKHTTVNSPATSVSPTPQKQTTVDITAMEVQPTHQKPTTVNVPATRVQPAPQKHTTVNAPTTGIQLTPQKHTTVNSPAASVSPTPQKQTTVDITATEVQPTHQKPTTVNVPTTRVQPTPEKPTTVNVPDAEVSPIPQKTITINISDTRAPLTPQKPTTANNSATKAPAAAQTSPIANVPSTVVPLAAQNPTMGNASATQTTPTTQTFTTAKASFIQSLPARQKSTPKRVSVTQRFTSARITATRPGPDSRTTTKSTTASEEKGLPSGHIGPICGKFGSRAVERNCLPCETYNPYFWKRVLSFNCLRRTIRVRRLRVPKSKWGRAFYQHVLWTPGGVVGVTIIGTIALVTYFWNRGKSGMKSAGTKKINYKTHENNKAPNVMFHNLSETDGTSEIRPPSDKLLKDTHI